MKYKLENYANDYENIEKKKKGPFCITKAFLQHMLTHCLKKIIINIHGFGGGGG